MDRKITIVGLETYDFKTPENDVLKLANLHYEYSTPRVSGVACGRVTVSQKFIDRYDIQMNGNYIGAFYLDYKGREKLAALIQGD